MTYDDIVQKMREVYENADAREIFEHIAVQVNIEGEVCGAFYIEIANREVAVEPYDYYDRDILVTVDSGVLMDIASGKISYQEALDQGKVSVKGDVMKYNMLNKIKMKQKAAKKAKKQ